MFSAINHLTENLNILNISTTRNKFHLPYASEEFLHASIATLGEKLEPRGGEHCGLNSLLEAPVAVEPEGQLLPKGDGRA